MPSPSYTGVRRQAVGMGHPAAGGLAVTPHPEAIPHLWGMPERGMPNQGVRMKALCQIPKALWTAQTKPMMLPAMGERMLVPWAEKMPGG